MDIFSYRLLYKHETPLSSPRVKLMIPRAIIVLNILSSTNLIVFFILAQKVVFNKCFVRDISQTPRTTTNVLLHVL